jgi:hypothetical protein
MDTSSALQNIILGAIASYIVVITTPWFINSFRYIISLALGKPKSSDLTGVYDCEYYIHWKPEGENVIFERVFIFKFGKHYRGFIINNDSKPNYRKVAKPALRLQGELFSERFLIGWWVDPTEGDNTRGGFNMKIDLAGRQHIGQWSGESTTYNKVLDGRWVWKKVPGFQYGLVTLLKQRLLRKKS